MFLMKKSKIILTDVDGVLLDWFTAFKRYMASFDMHANGPEHTEHDQMHVHFGLNGREEMFEYVETFNSGHWEFGTLPALDGAVEGMNSLADDGFKFIAITSCSTHPQTVALRKANLFNVFGDMFEEVHCVDVGESKRTHLSSHEPTFWLEDKASAAEDGLLYNHKPILITQSWNRETAIDSRIKRCHTWGEIVEYIKENW